MQIPKLLSCVMFIALVCANVASAQVAGTWDVIGPQTVTVKFKGAKKETDRFSTQDRFVFNADRDFSAEFLEGVGVWSQKGKNYKVKVDQPAVIEQFFEAGFEEAGMVTDVTVKSFSIAGTESKGKIKGTFIFKLYLDLLNGEYAYVTSTYKFTGTLSPDFSSLGSSRNEESGETGFSEFMRTIIREVVPHLAQEAKK